MTLRSCIFKKCGNYINLRDRSFKDVKLFSFPKNPERRKKWMELGEVPQNLPESMYFFCSDHFDKKYLAINNRRTVLVGEAVPFPYVDPEIDESNRDEEANLNYLMYDLGRSNNADKHEYTNDEDVVESTTITSNIQHNLNDFDDALNKEEPEEYIIFSEDESNKEEPISCTIKRKTENAFMQATSSKSKIIKTCEVQKPLQNSNEGNNDTIKSIHNLSETKKNILVVEKETCEDFTNSYDLVDAKNVTTFIFKGEEYVQMPKDYYQNEKIQFLKKIQKMERALQAIKGHLSSLDI